MQAIFITAFAVLLAGCGPGGGGDSTDPVVVENAVAFVKRPLLRDDNNGDIETADAREPQAFRPGARLFLKSRASPDAAPRDISSAAFSDPAFLNEEGELLYDVKDLDVSYDGSRLIFAMRAPEIEDADDDEQPTWNIWEFNNETGELRRIIGSDVVAEAGQDIAPSYLPDGRIVFSSTRQRRSRAILLDEGKPQFAALDEERDNPAFVLHVMNEDGSDIQQISFNQSHDLDPTVLADGRIAFSRWDNAGQTRDNGFNLYTVNPDGSGLSYLYGRHSHDSGGGDEEVHYLTPLADEDGNLLVRLQQFAPDDLGALPTAVDWRNFVEFDQTLDGAMGEGQTPLLPGLTATDEPRLEGRYRAAFPLFDGTDRFLVTWSPCRLLPADPEQPQTITNCTEERLAGEDFVAAPPLFGLWVLDRQTGTQVPIDRPRENEQITEAVLMTPRPLPDFIPPLTPMGEDRELADAGFGTVHIRSVYDFDGTDTTAQGIAALADPAQTTPGQRPARFVRVVKPVSIPDENVRDFDNSAFGRSAAQSMREILGYAPVEPDGSVKIAVPAGVAFGISVLDAQGRRIGPRHQNWLQVRPGETRECKGCHTGDSEVPHGRIGAGPPSINSGAPTTGQPFPNTEPALFANMGETMAETFARINGTRRLTADIVFEDEWTDPAVTAKADSFTLAYGDLATPAPISAACAIEWTSSCRTVIHYENHIHPLWGLDRRIFDQTGTVEIADYTCTNCHSTEDEMGATRVPAGQLDLTDGPSAEEPDHFRAYHELLFTDNEQILEDGALVDRMVDTGEFERDEEGELILDGAGNPIPILEPVPVPASMSTAGAQASDRFMNLFAEGGSHEDFLTAAELRLISEWLDIGAQYFNNPFAAPED